MISQNRGLEATELNLPVSSSYFGLLEFWFALLRLRVRSSQHVVDLLWGLAVPPLPVRLFFVSANVGGYVSVSLWTKI